MKRIFVGILSGFAFVVIASHFSFAQMYDPGAGPGRVCQEEGKSPARHDGMRMMKREHHLWRHLAGLGLDEKQKEAIKQIRSRAAKESVRKKADLAVARIELRDIVDKDQVDMGLAETTLKKMASLQTDLRLSRIKAMQEIKATLTPDQRKKFRELREMGPAADTMSHGGSGDV